MARKRDFKERIEVVAKYDPFYTGGQVQITQDGHFMLCSYGDRIKVVDIASGKIETTLVGKNNDELVSFILADDDKTVVTAAKNRVLEHWDLRERRKIKSWKSVGVGIISCMAFDSTSTFLATGGSDATIKVWDIVRKYYTHNFKGKGAQGVFSVVCFYENDSGLIVFGAAADYKIRAWSLESNSCIATLDGHYSDVTSLQFCADKKTLISGGKDSVVLLWNLLDFTLLKTIPIYASVQSVILVPEGRTLPDLGVESEGLTFITACSDGSLKVWDSTTGRCVHSQEDLIISSPQKGNKESITTQAFYNKALDAISIVTFEHNIVIYKLEDFSLLKQFVGNNDQVLDIKFMGENEEYLAVATNSPLIKIYEISTFACQLLQGHTDIVVSLDVFPKNRNMLISGSKDNSVLVWRMDSDTGKVQCIYMGYGHNHNVSAVACCKSNANFFVTGSEDKTLKVWDIPAKRKRCLIALKDCLQARCTVKAHNKMINSIAVSVNDKFIATGSYDCTAKVWSASDLTLVGTMSGHTKGVMCVEFSPVDQVLATASRDGTIKLWSLADCRLVKHFEEHMCAVEKILFLSKGTQLLSGACDGIMKLWNIKRRDCFRTETEHDSNVWALIASQNEDTIVSGGADSNIIVWKDVTEEKRTEEIVKHKDQILREQQLLNLMSEKKWVEAFGLAVELDQPLRTYKIMKEIMRNRGGRDIAQDAVTKMRDDQLENLIKYATEWSAIARHRQPVSVILSAIFKMKTPDEVLKMQNFRSNLAALHAYTARNYEAIVRAESSVAFLDFVLRNAKMVAEASDANDDS